MLGCTTTPPRRGRPAASRTRARPARVLLIGGTSEIGQAILAALDAEPG